MRGILSLGALVLMGASALAQADVYRWVDAQGEVHYSDRWVPGSTLIKVDRSRATPEAVANARSADQNRLAVTNDRINAQQAQNAESRAVQKDVQEARTSQCKDAKERYDKSIQARRIFRTGKDGEREYLNDAEADEYRLKARSEMQEACGASAS
jgi:Domain of unknown function (DUF4124)